MQSQIREKFILNDRILMILNFHCELNPFNLTAISNFKFYQLFYSLLLVVEFIVINCYVFIGFNYVKNDFISATQLFINIISAIQIYLNNYRLSKKYGELRKLLDATSSYFLFSNNKAKYIFKHNESKCTKIINIYFFMYISACLGWILSPLLIKEYPLKRSDGSLVIYHNNILNSFLSFIPISVYERIYPIVYLLEAFELAHICFEMFFYYTIVIQFCWMLSAQLKIITFKFESFGYKYVELEQKNDSYYMKNLNQIFLDQTKINVSIKKFHEIMKPMTWFTFVYCLNLLNALTYVCILIYFKNDGVLSVTFVKILLATSVVIIDLFVISYFYGYLENQMKVVQFAMYNIDWTKKSINFKKNLLLAMSLNNTNRLKMNITPQKSLNLEVFGSAMRVSYSIISLLAEKTISR
ncbi:uncharacterized protein LOC126901723 isoform X1 [Daktulosphaira vitifoliae]|uniref:uncharacterized protein LOC126901723 isoform X1 n=2 Tax=Daktulosphaira vitifoliae TaxID=58002 RepID=UPI0021A9C96B|nr:uncharacterized protein LOC126901723 isoform X1 [Daktulosphaira vitifoliae]XP_050534387.1 uncharacterized protein LOC126901723 isoform X1 [Daktulosphaira vitifoliae]